MLRPVKQVAPDDIFPSLPLGNALKALAESQPVAVEAHHRLYRAAWNAASVLPDTVNRFYRFGPPPSIVAAPGPLPYWWLYVADEAMTCVYEAGFCGHDARQPGSFYLDAHAVEHGLIGTMDFPTELKLLELTGRVAFTMGVFDLLSSSDHRWCQWFAYQLQAEGLFAGPDRTFDGLLYPSRKNRGKQAIALASAYVDDVRRKIVHFAQAFKETPEYRKLLGDAFRIDSP